MRKSIYFIILERRREDYSSLNLLDDVITEDLIDKDHAYEDNNCPHSYVV